MQRTEDVNVLLTVTGKQTDREGNTQENTVLYRAALREMEEGVLFSYRAQDEDVLLFVSRGSAWMERSGSRSTRMVFDPSVPSTQCSYMTAYGTIPMEIRTRNISVLSGGRRQKEDRSGIRDLQARIHYTLVMGKDYEQICSVTIKAQQTG